MFTDSEHYDILSTDWCEGDEMPTHLGAYLRELRQTRKWSTRWTAAELGCSHSYITLVELGERVPDLKRLWHMVDKLAGDYGSALFFLCVDSGVPEEAVRGIALQPDSKEDGTTWGD
jgi:transcriptional regulator with XRE-family HTH domain